MCQFYELLSLEYTVLMQWKQIFPVVVQFHVDVNRKIDALSIPLELTMVMKSIRFDSVEIFLWFSVASR
jgi:hypothetical protein